jgi:hypothetical protein
MTEAELRRMGQAEELKAMMGPSFPLEMCVTALER